MPLLDEWVYAFLRFIESGGDVLLVIMATAFVLWSLIIERYWYSLTAHRQHKREVLERWQRRSDHSSWHAHKVRDQLISEVREQAGTAIPLIATLVAVCPLLGLLGTVTGMIEVFDVMAATGSSNARAMAGGVSKATIPTMAGMVVAISGLFFSVRLKRWHKKEVEALADDLELR